MNASDKRILQNLDINYVGYWPMWFKLVLFVITIIVILAIGYFVVIKDKMDELSKTQNQEITLKQTFTAKAQKVANLPLYEKQLEEMNLLLNTLLQQLPKDTEVPALLEEMSRLGKASGLEIQNIKLQKEVEKDSFIEFPISIKAVGNYHEIASFVSGVSSMKRIITLHDYKLSPKDDLLSFDVTAKTYRYQPESSNHNKKKK